MTLVLISCSRKIATSNESQEKQDRIKVYQKEELKDQIHQKNETFEFKRPKQTQDKPVVGPDTIPDEI